MLLQQLLAPFSAGGAAAAKRRAAVAKARDELVAAVVDTRRAGAGTAQRRRRADDAVAALAAVAEGERLDLNVLGPGPFEVVYASGGFPLWRTTAELAERANAVFSIGGGKKEREEDDGDDDEQAESSSSSGVVSSQQFDPRTRALVNRVVYGPFAVSAFGEYAPVEEDDRPLFPVAVTADVQGGRLELGHKKEKSIDLPFIRGQGLFEVLYADRDVRVFRSPGPGGSTAAISVQMPMLKEEATSNGRRQQQQQRRRR